MSHSKTILLHDPIEFLIFNRDIISLTFAQTNYINGRITEYSDTTLSIQLDTDELDMASNSIGSDTLISCNYRSKRLEFNAVIIDYHGETKILTTSFPHQGKLVNYRLLERTFFDSDNSSLLAEIEIDTTLGHRTFKSNQFFEFSYHAISMFVDRNQGLIVPNDVVDRITIKSKKNTIFQATGKVSRIEKTESDNNRLFIVIQLDDPNAKPILDIEPNKRQSDRFIFENRNDAFVEFVHPFSQSKKMAQLLDISNSGISIIMQGTRYAMPPGLLIEKASMQLPMHTRLDVGLRVKGYYQEIRDSEDLKVSMEFVNATPMLVKEVSNFVQHKLSSHLEDATFEDVNELWHFYFETGFIYKGKRQQLQSNAEVVKETFRLLLKSNTPLLKKILYKEEGIIKGHVTAIKVFDHALMVQHLNALKANSGSAAMQVIRGITSYFLDNRANHVSGNRYICFYYRPDNLYPALVFGEAVNLIDDEDLCWVDTYQFCLPAEDYPVIQNDDIEVYEASSEDLSNLETLLISNNDFNILRLEGLVRETMANMSITEAYERIGLYRYRRVFVAKIKTTGQRIYAVCSYASPGLNFSELTNSIKLFYSSDVKSTAQLLTDAVCAYALQTYLSTPVHNPALLLKSEQPVPASFVIEKNYTLFALDVRHTKKFKDATEHIFANLKEFVRKKKAV